MVVSTISSGAESVAVSALPVLPKTEATSGTVFINLSVVCNNAAASAGETPGKVEGIYSRSPSLIFGRNSPPTWLRGQITVKMDKAATIRVVLGQLSTRISSG
ncbi:Uncharacterised protein [Enterobacter roggenkampii]|nr:Uncharacterised protein [Enterobacter roggenkampii]